ncbi:MAG: HAMP domain-containing histidine kinase [Bifidobacteriaceae bacterium]|jgi:two-component system sensor histidine kinase VanS|nr:HAMP domain-containing histidine kinase [Bifidobacteriaceae bacterium]
MDRQPGPSVRLKLTLSYAALVLIAGTLVLAIVWAIVLRSLPDVGVSPRGMLVRADILHSIAISWVLVMGFLLAFGLVGGWMLAGRMLAPLSRITAATRKAAGGSLSHRIDLEGRHDEFRELADSFDAMLARLEAHVAEQQRFAASASHELRTPLAVTQTLLDVARKDPDYDADELVARLHTVNARAIAMTEALLILSRAEQRSFVPERLDLSLIVEDAAETLLPLAEKRGITIDTVGDAAPVSGSDTLLGQMAVNLLHNAIVHNLPDHGAIWAATSTQHGTVVFTVENTGNDINPEVARTLTEPFQRGTGRAHSDLPGFGLGLAIAQSIVHAHHGTLTLTPRHGGGLVVTVRLAARQAAAERHRPG